MDAKQKPTKTQLGHTGQSNEEANRLTRECLKTAVLQLAATSNFDKITVTEITKRAGVSRPSFYRNYDSIEDLVSDACNEVRTLLLQSLSSKRYQTNRRQWYKNVFTTIRNHARYFQVYLDANVSLIGDDVLEAAYPSDDLDGLYANRAREGAFLSVLTGWFKTGMKESSDSMADLCMEVLGRL